jgi:hypothetical protein
MTRGTNALAGWPGRASLGAPALFAATVFLNAALLIAVQPMISKMLLPLLGGAPAVWNTALVFFQTTLLLGYAYAHLAATRLDARLHVGCHLALVVLGLVLLPLGVDARPFGSFTAADHPVIWVLLRLAVTVGLPFLALSAGAPALQVWFSSVPHVRARDPYVLYAASNAGSLIALLSYPVLVEPQLSLRRQAELWTVGYAGLLLLLIACALSTGQLRPITGRRRPARWWRRPSAIGTTEASPDDTPIGARRRLRWAALSFVPSSALLGVTTLLTTDIGAVPLLWVVPLALYLASFVLAFGRRPAVPSRALAGLLPAMVLLVVLVDVSRMTLPLLLLVCLHLGTFFVVALGCHGELARKRPAPVRLTEYYLVIAAAGALGGVGNALIAPVLFTGVAEYPFVLVVACLLVPWARRGDASTRHGRALDVALPLVVGALTAALVWTAPLLGL